MILIGMTGAEGSGSGTGGAGRPGRPAAAASGRGAVAEAHWICEWGHGCRPDCRGRRARRGGLPPGVPVLACTASANAGGTADVADRLGDGLVVRGRLDRESLRLSVLC